MAIVGRYVSEVEFYTSLGGQDSVNSVEQDEDVLNSALDSAEEQIDSFLVRRYFLPESVEETPGEFKRIVLELVRYWIKSTPLNSTVPTTDNDRYDTQIAYLEKVRTAKPDSPSVVGLIERRKITELRLSTQVLDSFRQPVQSGKLDLLRPIDDRDPKNCQFDEWDCPLWR